jgi:hypothetical protein
MSSRHEENQMKIGEAQCAVCGATFLFSEEDLWDSIIIVFCKHCERDVREAYAQLEDRYLGSLSS